MTRRKLITLLGGLIAAPVAHPFVARADRTRRIGLLINLRSDDPEGQNRLMAFVQALQKFGWTEGSNIHFDLRWASDDADLSRRYAKELVALAPDVLLASGTQAVVAFQRVTRSVPIVFVNATDPVGAGFVSSVARPGGNTTGFVAFEYSVSGKWLELLKKLAPQTTRVAVLRDPALASNIGQFAAIQSAASFSSGVELSVIDLHDVNEIERGLGVFGHEPNGAIITLASPSTAANRKLVISLLRRYACRISIRSATTRRMVASPPTGQTQPSSSSAQLSIWIASSKARNRANFPCKRRPNMSWSSTSRLPKR